MRQNCRLVGKEDHMKNINRFRLLFALLLLATFGVVKLSTAARTTLAPLSCTGYAEPRIFVESQAWWQVTPGSGGDEDFGRVSTALCFPFKQHVHGTVPLDVRLSMHNSPGKLTDLTVQVSPDGSGQYVVAKKTFKPPLTCASDCSWLIHLDANTSRLSVDGMHEWRIRPKIATPDGDSLVGSTSYQAYTANGHPVKNYRPADFLQGKGWYSSMGYAQSRITSGYTYGAPVSGTWNVSVACDATNNPTTGCLVLVDPGLNLASIGTVLLSRSSGFSGNLAINTRTLSNGPHQLLIKSDAISTAQGSTLTGVLLLPFVVNN
jgi:hypothetical protein